MVEKPQSKKSRLTFCFVCVAGQFEVVNGLVNGWSTWSSSLHCFGRFACSNSKLIRFKLCRDP